MPGEGVLCAFSGFAPARQLAKPNSDRFIRECRHIHRHSRESGNPKAIGSNPVFASYRILGSRFRGNDGNRRLETDILKLTTLPSRRPPVEPGVQSKLNGCIIGGAPIRGHSIGEDGPGDFMPVPQGPVFRHGTRAQPFDRLAPGTSVATAIGLGRNIATGGSCYADTPQDGTLRVMRLQVDLPHGARFIPADSKTRREVAHLEKDMAFDCQHPELAEENRRQRKRATPEDPRQRRFRGRTADRRADQRPREVLSTFPQGPNTPQRACRQQSPTGRNPGRNPNQEPPSKLHTTGPHHAPRSRAQIMRSDHGEEKTS